jgi:hypothetical protein
VTTSSKTTIVARSRELKASISAPTWFLGIKSSFIFQWFDNFGRYRMAKVAQPQCQFQHDVNFSTMSISAHCQFQQEFCLLEFILISGRGIHRSVIMK